MLLAGQCAYLSRYGSAATGRSFHRRAGTAPGPVRSPALRQTQLSTAIERTHASRARYSPTRRIRTQSNTVARMPPNLDAMFNRNENLSTRRPLLPDEAPGRYQLISTHRPDGTGRRPPPPPTPRPFRDDRFVRQNSFGKPLGPEACGYGREKVAYFGGRPEERRQTELMFRFDTRSSEHLGSAGRALTSDAPDRFGSGVVEPRLVPPDKDGPFVFGVHSPSQFRLPNRPLEADYDYASVEEEKKPVEVKCERVNEWNARGRAKSLRVLNRMFQIKDNRCRKVSGGKKDKIKCVLVGDGAVGKSSLITAYAQNKFRNEYEPTAYDTFNVVVEVDDRPVSVEICDTAGQDSMSELRALCYEGADVLMLCFSVVRPETFRSVAGGWVRAVSGLRAPLVLVGTQADLASDPHVLAQLRLRGEHVVTESEARALAASINAEYIETSAKTRSRLKDAFDSAILAGLPVVRKKQLWKKLFCVK